MGPACSICGGGSRVIAPKVLVEDDDEDGDHFQFKGRQCRYVSITMEDPPTPSKSTQRMPIELARQTLAARPLCVERYAPFLGEARAVEFTAAVACIALHCRGAFLNDIESGKLTGAAMQQMVAQAFRPILQVVKRFGGDVISVPSDRPTLFVVWDQSHAEETLEGSPTAAIAPCTTPHEALYAAVSCLLALRSCLPPMEHFQSLQTLVAFGEVTLQSPWGLHTPSVLLSGKPIRALSTILDQSFASHVILHRDTWALVKEWCVHVPTPNRTAQYVEVSALRRASIVAPTVWTKPRLVSGSLVELGQPTTAFLPLTVPPGPWSQLGPPGAPTTPANGSRGSSVGEKAPPEALVADVATLAKQNLSVSLELCPGGSTVFLQQRATVFAMALPYTRLSADAEGAILPQFLRTMCRIVGRNGGKLAGLCQWRQYLLLTAVFYPDGGGRATPNAGCLNALRTCLDCAREAGLAQPLFTVTSGCVFVTNFLHERRVVSLMCGRPLNWWLGLVSMPDFGEQVIWCDPETRALAEGHFQAQAVDTLRKPLCWGMRHAVAAVQELSHLQLQSLREYLGVHCRPCIVRGKERGVLDGYIVAVVKAGVQSPKSAATLVPTVYLWGSAAMGKSTLLAALQARWAAFPVFGVRCAEPEELQAFIAVRHLLGAIFAWLKSCPAFPGHLPAHRVQDFVRGCVPGLDPRRMATLEYVLPGRFRGQPESPIAAEEPPAETDPAETFLGADLVPAVCEVLQALCLAMQGLVVCIDDAHFLDAESRAVFGRLHEWAAAGRRPYLQVLAANRLLLPPPQLAPSHSHTLAPLAPAEVQAVLEDRLDDFLWDGERLAPGVTLVVEAATRGHPLLVNTLADHLAVTVTQVEPQPDGLVTLDSAALESIPDFTFSSAASVCQAITRLYNSLSTDEKKVIKIAAVFISSQCYCGLCWELLRAMFPAEALPRFEAAFTALVDGGVLITQANAIPLVQGWLSYDFVLGPTAELLALKVPAAEAVSIRAALFHEVQQHHSRLTAHPNSYLCWATLAVHAGRQEVAQAALRMAEAACPAEEVALLQVVREEKAALQHQLEAGSARHSRAFSRSSVSSILLPFTPPHNTGALLAGRPGGTFRRKKLLVKTGVVEIDGLLKRLSTLATHLWQHGPGPPPGGDYSPRPHKLLGQLQRLEALELAIASDCLEHVDCQIAITTIRDLTERPDPSVLGDPGKLQDLVGNQLKRFAQQCTDLFGTRAKALRSDPAGCPAQWSPEYSVHVGPVVQHHQELLYLLRQLLASLKQGGDKAANFRAAAAALMHLAEVLLDTFRMEESVMCLLQYPRLADHVASHRLFLLQVVDLQAQLQVESEGLGYELCLLLYQWFTTHLNVSDREFGVWVAARFPDLPYPEVRHQAIRYAESSP